MKYFIEKPPTTMTSPDQKHTRDSMNRLNTSPRTRPGQYFFFLLVLLLICFVLGFSGVLHLSTFSQNFKESLLASFSVAGQEAVRKIEYAVGYGKPLTSFYRMNDILKPVKQDAPGVEEVRVILPEGTIIYTDSETMFTGIEDKIINHGDIDFNPTNPEVTHRLVGVKEKNHLFLPIRNRNGAWIGSIDLVFDQEIINGQLRGPLFRMLWFLLGTLGAGILVLMIVHKRKPFLSKTGEIQKKSFLTVILLILGASQIWFGWMNYGIYRTGYLNAARENGALISRIIQRDVGGVIQKGVPYGKLYGLDQYLKEMTRNLPEIGRVELSDSSGTILYSSLPSPEPKETPMDSSTQIRLALTPDLTGKTALLSVELSTVNLAGKMRTMILDTLTLIVISFIFMVEMTLFVVFIFERRKGEVPVEEASLLPAQSKGFAFIRPLAFLLFFAIFMKGSFIPIIMNDLYQPLFGLSKNMITALPLTLEVLFGGLATLTGGAIYDRKGWKTPFFGGVLIVALGTFISGISHSAAPFLVARSIAGVGYGFCYIALRSLINESKSESQRTEGLSAFISGLYAGVMSGVAVGSLLADRLGFSAVFLVSFVIVLLAGAMALVWLPRETTARSVSSPKNSVSFLQGVGRFLGNRQVFSLLILGVIPLTICEVFLEYYFPLFISNQGLSISQIGRAFLLNGLCIVYLGPWFSKWSNRSFSSLNSVVFSGLITTTALIFFAVQGTVTAAFVTVILLGIADSFGLVAQNNYYLSLPATSSIGSGKALGYYDNVRKIGQMVGPVTFAGLAVSGIMGVGLIGLGALVSLVIFRIMGRTGEADVPDLGVNR